MSNLSKNQIFINKAIKILPKKVQEKKKTYINMYLYIYIRLQ